MYILKVASHLECISNRLNDNFARLSSIFVILFITKLRRCKLDYTSVKISTFLIAYKNETMHGKETKYK